MMTILGRLVSVVPALVIWVASPFWKFRIGYFFADRIGHFAFDVEYYLSLVELEGKTRRSSDLFFFKGTICNTQLAKMVRREVIVVDCLSHVHWVLSRLPWSDHLLLRPNRMIDSSRDKAAVLARTSAHLNFTDDEKARAQTELAKLGLIRGHPFVCLIVRESAYLDYAYPGKDWGYHDFRDCDISRYKSASSLLTKQGYFVIRMGKTVIQSFSFDSNSKIIDYAKSEFRSDLLDIWLMANCEFSVSSGTGLDSVSDIFRRPVVYANYDVFPLVVTWANSITVPKKLVWKSSGNQLSIEEYCLHSYAHSDLYDEAGISVIEMEPEEIVLVVQEMLDRLQGRIRSRADIELQEMFWSIFQGQDYFSKQHGVRHNLATIGSNFLKDSAVELFRTEKKSGQTLF